MTSEQFINEARRMHQLRHPKLLLLMGVCTREQPFYIITELMANGSLLEYLKRIEVKSTNVFNVIIDMAAQVNLTSCRRIVYLLRLV